MREIGSILEGLHSMRIVESAKKSKKSKKYKKVTLDKAMQELNDRYGEYDKLLSNLEALLKSMGKSFEAIVFYDERSSIEIRIFGWHKEYADSWEFEKLHSKESLEKYTNSVIKNFLGFPIEGTFVSTYWDGKVSYDNKQIKIGPYIEIALDADKCWNE